VLHFKVESARGEFLEGHEIKEIESVFGELIDPQCQELFNVSDSQFVYSTYKVFLNRCPDFDGFMHYRTAMQSGKSTRFDVLRSIACSREAKLHETLTSREIRENLFSQSMFSRLIGIDRIRFNLIGLASAGEKPPIALGLSFERGIHDCTVVARRSGAERLTGASGVLLVSYYAPTRAHAGGLRILDIYRLIKRMSPETRIDLFTHHRPAIDWTLDDAYDIFDEVFLASTDSLSLPEFRKMCPDGRTYDVVDLQFHQSGAFADDYREIAGKVIFTPMESLSRAAFIAVKNRAGSYKFNDDRLRELWYAFEELSYCRTVDQVVAVSRPDAAFIRRVGQLKNVVSLDTAVSDIEFNVEDDPVTVAGRQTAFMSKTLLYLAYFGSQTNVDALKWFLERVHPLIRKAVPDYRFRVVGRGDLSVIRQQFTDPSIEYVGEVTDIAPEIRSASVGVAPALYGAGFRGKINQYSVLNLPCVASGLAISGLGYESEKNILRADTDKEFAAACIRLLTDEALNKRIGANAFEYCQKKYSWLSRWEKICSIYGLSSISGSTAERNVLSEPLVTILVPSYNHIAYLDQRIESIYAQKYKKFELIVIDDCSSDGSDIVLKKLQQRYPFQYIRNEKNSGTPFSAWKKIIELSKGDYIWICESDDFAEREFLETAVRHLEADRNLVLFYSNSWIVDESGERIGATIDYLSTNFKSDRWENSFKMQGLTELCSYQIRGQTVPNMSSSLIRKSAFAAAYSDVLMKYRLAGDWLFIGEVMRSGDVQFDSRNLSNFRKHAITARAQTSLASSQAEFICAKYEMFKKTPQLDDYFAEIFMPDMIRFIHEKDSAFTVLRLMYRISPNNTKAFLKRLFKTIRTDHDVRNTIKTHLRIKYGLA